MTLAAMEQAITEVLDQPDKLIEFVADPGFVRNLENCAPGVGEPIYVYRQEDLIGLYTAGKEIYRRLFLADTPDDVLRLLHPSNILPARTYLRMLTFTAGQPARVVVYGPVAGGTVAYGPVDGGAVEAYGYETEAGTPGDEFDKYLEEQQASNNNTPEQC